MFVTRTTLMNLDACGDYRDAFDVLFPNGTLVTPELCVNHARVFSWDWAVDELLSSAGQREFIRTFDPAVDPEVADLQRRRETISSEWRTFVADWAVRHNINARSLNWRELAPVNAMIEYRRRIEERRDEHAVVARQLDVVRARTFGELAGLYEANRVRWATEETRLDDLFDVEAYHTTTTPTTAPTSSSYR
jgi:hypothetical protein